MRIIFIDINLPTELFSLQIFANSDSVTCNVRMDLSRQAKSQLTSFHIQLLNYSTSTSVLAREYETISLRVSKDLVETNIMFPSAVSCQTCIEYYKAPLGHFQSGTRHLSRLVAKVLLPASVKSLPCRVFFTIHPHTTR
jgi:hypothetical protein